jgi:DNA invertase Pin-like site-specific DNA recombinase
MKKNAVELIRVSTEAQAREDRAGIPAQREVNRRTARSYNLHIVRSIEIVDVSGASVLRSPEMQELLRLMESSDIHGVITKEFSRLIRPENFTDYALLQHFIDTETILYLPDGPIDLASKSGRLLGTIRAAIAGLERREILERMNDGKEAMRRQGKHPSGAITLPLGVGYHKERGWYYTGEVERVKQAFALFLSGETSYTEIGRRLNLPRTNVRFLLGNPIYTGWKVYDQKRDPSTLGYVPGPDGRQGYRKKIKRAPEEVIRKRVLDGLVSEEDFARVQEMVELKRLKHWRACAETPSRYTYNGFLTCGECSSLIYTHASKHDFYMCKSRHPRERRKRAERGLEPCTNRYMLRSKLEGKLDHLLGQKLTERDFLLRVVEEYNEQLQGSQLASTVDERAVGAKLSALGEKKQRVLETFFEGMIDKEERDRRVTEIDRDISAYQQLMMESTSAPAQPPALDEESVLAAIEPFTEWEFLEREDRRSLLAVLCPEISVYRYTVKGLTLNLALGQGSGDEGSHRKMG